MSTQKAETDLGKRDKFITAEIYRFIREFQNIEIRVKPENTEEIAIVFVHPPYMLQSVTLVDNDEEFKRLKERHQTRLQKVKEARETTDGAVREFLNRQFYENNGREKYVASGRSELEEIRKLLQEAVDQGLIPTSSGAKYPDGYDMREWLKKYGTGELKEWAERIKGMAKKARRVVIFLNNCHQGQAAKNARMLQDMFENRES